ncbi:unnamed protein product [Lupinus luteus]|uniref:Uncharacterized protein n=1 Tax=Lupinus luteus TaxID=3873 RepID=A0AAV1XCL4_LUPLU
MGLEPYTKGLSFLLQLPLPAAKALHETNPPTPDPVPVVSLVGFESRVMGDYPARFGEHF